MEPYFLYSAQLLTGALLVLVKNSALYRVPFWPLKKHSRAQRPGFVGALKAEVFSVISLGLIYSILV